jgi:histidyl-tRNA synthetase
LDKIGLEKVKDELKQKGFHEKQLGIIEKYLSITGSNSEKIKSLNELIGSTESGKKGIDELNKFSETINYHLSTISSTQRLPVVLIIIQASYSKQKLR